MLYHQILASTALLAVGIDATSHYGTPNIKRQAPEGMVDVNVVRVGDMEGGLKFYPEVMEAQPGSMIQFQFYPKNHSVVQSTFDNPCEPISNSMSEQAGIGSGFMPMEEDATEMPVFTVMVNDTNPMWLYCGQPGHCEKGMVMAVNLPQGGNRTMDQFKAKAASAGSGGTGSSPPLGTGTGAFPTATGGGGVGGVTTGQPTPSSPPSSTLDNAPLEATANVAPKPMGETSGFMALFVAAIAVLGL